MDSLKGNKQAQQELIAAAREALKENKYTQETLASTANNQLQRDPISLVFNKYRKERDWKPETVAEYEGMVNRLIEICDDSRTLFDF